MPVPRPFALCEDNSVNGAPFYVMEYREGVIIAETLPAGYAETAEARRAIGIGMVERSPNSTPSITKPWGSAISGARRATSSARYAVGTNSGSARRRARCQKSTKSIRRLRNALPESPAPTIVHGDYRLGNMMMAFDEPGRVVAILDWEMCTLGDPLSDLGYTLMYWTEEGDDPNPRQAASRPRYPASPRAWN